jgi:hypothetical protein
VIFVQTLEGRIEKIPDNFYHQLWQGVDRKLCKLRAHGPAARHAQAGARKGKALLGSVQQRVVCAVVVLSFAELQRSSAALGGARKDMQSSAAPETFRRVVSRPIDYRASELDTAR